MPKSTPPIPRKTPTNRRNDVIYFGMLLAVGIIGVVAANRSTNESNALELPDFEPPSFDLELEAPFDFPYPVVRFKERKAPKLVLAGNVESVLLEVRSVLLESSTSAGVEVDVPVDGHERQLASALE